MSPLQCLNQFSILFIFSNFGAMSSADVLCSNVVRYSSYKFERVGIIEVPISNIKNSIKLDVRLVMRGTLPTRYVGQIELAEAEKFKVTGTKKEVMKVIKFRVRFPIIKPLPLIQNISLNDEKFCDGNLDIFSYYGPVVTQIKLQYELQIPFTFQNDSSSGLIESNEDYYNKYNVKENCGSSRFPFGSGVAPEKKSDWPWFVAVNVKSESSEVLLCSGTLVTAKHVITAAHCVSNHQKANAVDQALVVYLGIINKNFELNSGISEYRKVSNVHINPFFEKDPFNANVAVLELSESVLFSEYIKPACLWQQIPNLSPILEEVGVVALWIVDVDGSLVQTDPSFIQVEVKNSEECALEESNHPYTLCTVALTDLNWCPGVYGGELLIRYKENSSADSKWRLRGIIQFPFETESCSASKQLLFTDIAMYSDWFAQILESSLF